MVSRMGKSSSSHYLISSYALSKLCPSTPCHFFTRRPRSALSQAGQLHINEAGLGIVNAYRLLYSVLYYHRTEQNFKIEVVSDVLELVVALVGPQ